MPNEFNLHVSQRHIPQYVGGELLSEPGFTLPLSRGSPILSVAVAGLCASNSSSHILARTSSEVRQCIDFLLENRIFVMTVKIG